MGRVDVRKMLVLSTVALTFCLLCSAAEAPDISGTVVDENGKAVKKAQVFV